MSINSDITAFFVNMYSRSKDEGKKYVPNSSVVKQCMGAIYNQFIKEGLIIPIENLERNDKELLAAECRATGQFYTNQTLITSCRILHLIKTILNNT